MIWLLLGAALAGGPTVTVREGKVLPGIATELLVDVSSVGDREAPRVVVEAGTIVPSSRPTPEGILALRWHPPLEVRDVTVRVGEHAQVLSVELPPTPSLKVPAQFEGIAGRPVRLELRGEDLPAPEDIAIDLAEGRLLKAETTEGGIRLTIDPGPADYARFLPIALRDLRADVRPTFSRIRLRTRAAVSLDTEPDTAATFEVGGRIYGPFRADADGIVRATVDQYPGESTVRVLLEDDLGNETTGALPLRTRRESRLLAVVTGALAPGRPSPLVYLHAIRADGRLWDGAAPFCRTPSAREVSLTPVQPGAWLTSPPLDHQIEQLPLRFVCSLPDGVEVSARVSADEDVPARLRLRVWPQDLSNDSPLANVTAALENSRGERLPSAELAVSARRGTLHREPAAGFAVEAEYRGQGAVTEGTDVVEARWDPAPGLGRIADLSIGWAEEEAGAVQLFTRAIDDAGLPRSAAEVRLRVGEITMDLRTDRQGWASTFVPVSDDAETLLVEASAAGVVRRALRPAGAPAWWTPETPLLRAEASITISPGRIAAIRPTVDPPVLYSGPRASASFSFEVVDRGGQAVGDAQLTVTASEGTLSEVSAEPGGRYRVELRPSPGDRQREVLVTASAEGAAASATLLIEPRPIDRALSLAAGVQSNLRRITSPALALDLDQRLPILNRSTLLRLGFSLYGTSETVQATEPTNDDDVRVSLRLAPVTLAMLARRESGGRGVWLGLGGVFAGYSITASYGPDSVGTGVGLLTPGPVVFGGVGQRFSGGEIMAEARFTSLNGPSGDIAFTKQVGGVGLWLGYRLIY